MARNCRSNRLRLMLAEGARCAASAQNQSSVSRESSRKMSGVAAGPQTDDLLVGAAHRAIGHRRQITRGLLPLAGEGAESLFERCVLYRRHKVYFNASPRLT